MKNLVIDVGANKGDFSFDILSRNPSVHVLAIEPIPKLCAEILERAEKAGGSASIEVIQCAVDIEERSAFFNVADHADMGVSSLLSFAENLIDKDCYWKIRSDLYFDETIPVRVRRLDNILIDHAVEKILFIKVDAQGLDVNVLYSLGEYLHKTEAGMLEVSATLDTRLYKDEQYDLHKALNVLDEMGFKTYAIKPNDHAANEFNVYFCRKGLTAVEVESSLNLSGIHLYDGKHFWHAPSAQYRPAQEMDVEVLLADINEIEKIKQNAAVRVNDAEARISDAEARISDAEARISDAEARANDAETQLRQALQTLNAIYLSSSWWVTRPIRYGTCRYRALRSRLSAFFTDK